MNYALIIYLIGVLINCYFIIIILKEDYNDGEVITIGDIFKNIIICSLSWLVILYVLITWLCMHIYIIFTKPLFKKHK